MNDTYITIIGTVLNRPEKRVITKTNALVASFRLASHPRRYDRESQRWVDAPSLRIKVNCWRRLGEGVCSSLIAGDPVIVYGRITTREWKTDEGGARLAYEVEAFNVGHDLGYGTTEFHKTRTDQMNTVVEDDDADNRVNGELTQGVEPPFTAADDLPYGEELGDDYALPDLPVTDLDAMAILREAGLDPAATEGGGEEDTGEEELSGAAPDSGGSPGRSRRRGRQPVPA